MKSLKFWMVATLMTTFSLGGFAATLTPEEALARATDNGMRKVTGISSNNLQLVYTQTDAKSIAACYVFGQSSGGYMVVSADDVAPAVLGFSDTGHFSSTEMPDGLKYWLEAYAAQIEWARKNASAAPVKAVERPWREPIKPLVATKWNQSSPFNNKCPLVGTIHCMTGCVATAMAQAMKYHNWPAKGEGSYSYTWNGQTLSMDFSTVTFDWDNMIDTYGSDATANQNNAVATLMSACGISVKMSYGTRASGAVQAKVASALINYFGYSKGVYSANREYYGLLDWEELIYNNLRECGPVVYGGQSNDGGHSFICDGYLRNGYFHINWGWGGLSDGYFLLTALNPDVQGIGGSTSGYNFDQDAILGIKKPVEGEEDAYHYIMGSTGDLTLGAETATVNSWIRINTAVYSFSPVNITGRLAFKIESLSTGEVTYGNGSSFTDLGTNMGYGAYSVTVPSDLPDGEYRVTPAFLVDDGEWQEVSFPVGSARYKKMTVNGNNLTFSEVEAASVSVTEVVPATKMYIGRDCMISAILTNTSDTEYYGIMTGVLIDSNNKIVATGDSYPIDILGGQSTTIAYMSEFAEFTGASAVVAKDGKAPRRALSTGTYKLAFAKGEIDSDDTSDATKYTYLSDKVDVQMEADPGAATLNATDLKFADGNSTSVNAYEMKLTAKITCTAGYASEAPTLYIFPYSGGTAIGSIPGEPIFLSSGESTEVTFKGRFANGTPGQKYFCEVRYGSEWISSPLIFTLADIFTGIDNAQVGKQIAGVKVYTLGGVQVSETTNGLMPGTYIIVTTYTDGTVQTAKVIR